MGEFHHQTKLLIMKAPQHLSAVGILLMLFALLSSFVYIPASKATVFEKRSKREKVSKKEQTKQDRKAEKQRFKLNRKFNKLSRKEDAAKNGKVKTRLGFKLDRIEKQMESKDQAMALVAMIFGIIAISLCLLSFALVFFLPILFYFSFLSCWVFVVLAIVFGTIAAVRNEGSLGLVLGLVTVGLAFIFTIVLLFAVLALLLL